MSDKRYELHHGDGGHGGPYTLDEAIERGKKLAVSRVSNGVTHRAHEWVFDSSTRDGTPLKTIVAKRCRDCGEIHTCVR